MTGNGATPALALSGVAKSYGGVRALSGLDFEVADVYGYLGALPVAGRPGRSGDDTAEPHYRRRPALTAGGYLLKARKRVSTLTLVRPRRRARQRVLLPAAEPTSKVGP